MSQMIPLMKERQLDFQKLESLGDEGLLLVQLMWVCNDLAVANQCLGLTKDGRLLQPHQKLGGQLYFVRLQCGHIHEAMKLIEEIQNNPSLRARVKNCSEMAQKAFTRLEEYFSNDPVHKKHKEYLAQIRNNLVFHYQNREKKKQIKNALVRRASKPDGRLAPVTDSNDVRLLAFEAADRLLQTILCREIFKIKDPNAEPEADKIVVYLADLCHSFVKFAADFAIRYMEAEGIIHEA